MPNRSVRVNELVKREISQVLHTNYRERAVVLTITDVDVSPDLRAAYVFYSVIGDESVVEDAEKFFSKEHKNIRQHLSKVIVLKYLPKLKFRHDDSFARGARIIDLLDEIDETEEDDESEYKD